MRLSRDGLVRMHEVMAGHVERGEAPGLITAIWRHGDLTIDAIGAMAMGGAPMRSDTIVRITSMTKPIIAVATLILAEECRLRLDDPVERFLPELADRQVLRRIDGPIDDTVPADRSITVRDLLTFRMGLGLIIDPWEKYPIQIAARDLGLALGPPLPFAAHGPDEWIRRLGTLPLMYQPGERWLYDTGSDVLGVLIARAAGQPLERVLRERIFEPLGMRDTAFQVPPEKLDRFASSYAPDPVAGTLAVHDDAGSSPWSKPAPFPSGASGLVSTLDDYLAFGRMLLAKGRHDGRPILSRPAVEAMTTDQLTPAQKARSPFFPGFWDGQGWGFGVSIVTKRDGIAASPGRFGWDGGFGTSWACDPAEDLCAVLLTQRPGADELFADFWTSVYAAMDD